MALPPAGGEEAYGLEVTHADGSPAPFNQIADLVVIDSQTGEIKLIGYRGDVHNPNGKDLRLRVVVERNLPHSGTEPPRRERYASAYFYPIRVQADGTPVEGRYLI